MCYLHYLHVRHAWTQLNGVTAVRDWHAAWVTGLYIYANTVVVACKNSPCNFCVDAYRFQKKNCGDLKIDLGPCFFSLFGAWEKWSTRSAGRVDFVQVICVFISIFSVCLLKINLFSVNCQFFIFWALPCNSCVVMLALPTRIRWRWPGVRYGNQIAQ